MFATVYPFESSDGTQGYLSCRRKPTSEEIEKAQRLYDQWNKQGY